MTSAVATVPSPGLAGVVAGRTAISSLEGGLRYRGYAVDQLAARGDFEEVAFLLLHGELPTAAEHGAFVRRVSHAAASLDPAVVDALAALARREPSASVMDAVRTAVSMLGQIERDDRPGDRLALVAQAERLLGQIPAALVAWLDLAAGRPVAAWPTADSAAPAIPLAKALLERMRGGPATAEEVRLFGTTLVLYAEHEFNASTFAARTVVSTGSDMHSGICAGVAALKGPLHGGANEQVLDQLAEIGSIDRAEAWVSERLAAKRVIMGFGHRVYKDGDERAVLLGKLCREFAAEGGRDAGADAAALEHLAARVAEIMLERKGLKPNLDWPAARVYHALGLPVSVFTPIFAVARTSGWAAHIIEQIGDNRLIRPMSVYVGPAARECTAR